MAPLLATGSDLRQGKRGRGAVSGCESGCEGGCAKGCGDVMQVYVDEDGDKVGVIEKEEYIEFVDAVGDFDFVSDFSRFRCLGSSGDVMTLYKKNTFTHGEKLIGRSSGKMAKVVDWLRGMGTKRD